MDKESNERTVEGILNRMRMKTQSYQNRGDAAWAIFRGKFIVLKVLY